MSVIPKIKWLSDSKKMALKNGSRTQNNKPLSLSESLLIIFVKSSEPKQSHLELEDRLHGWRHKGLWGAPRRVWEMTTRVLLGVDNSPTFFWKPDRLAQSEPAVFSRFSHDRDELDCETVNRVCETRMNSPSQLEHQSVFTIGSHMSRIPHLCSWNNSHAIKRKNIDRVWNDACSVVLNVMRDWL